MSDFGALLSIQKKDKTSFTETEMDAVKAAAEQIKNSTDLVDSLGNPYKFAVGKTARLGEPGCFEMNVLLSEYWGSEEEDFEFAQEIDEDDAKTIAKEIGEQLGAPFVVNSQFDWW